MSSKHVDISYDLIEGIYNTLDYQGSDKLLYQSVARIKLTRTKGTAIVLCNGISKTLTYATSLTTAAANFVTSYAADYLASGILLTSITDTIIFTTLPGVNFSGVTTITSSISDYYLPSKNELDKIWVNLLSGTDEHGNAFVPIPYVFGVSGYLPNYYWSSTEDIGFEATHMEVQSFVDGTQSGGGKVAYFYVLACRNFTSLTNYNLRDTGPAGGYIFYKDVNNYWECPKTYQGRSLITITNASVGVTLPDIGSGQSNSTLMINQIGNTVSPALVCDQLNEGTDLPESAIITNVTYPIYKSIPKTPASVYVFIGNVIDVEDGTKDTFSYMGTVQIHIVDNSQMRADLKLAQSISGVVRGYLKPDKSTLFSISPLNLVVFDPDNSNTLKNESEGITNIRIVDIYNFIIN